MRRRISRSALLIGLTTLAAALTAAPAEAATTTYYVDCSAAANGTGTSTSSPYNSLTPVNALTLTAGDQVLFLRGTACSGQLAPRATGTAAAPVVIGAYGTGDRPAINADGAVNAVLLDNTPYTTVQDLELTADGDNTAYRRGVYVYAADAGTVSGITLQRLDIHDVRGVLPATVSGNYHGTGKYANATGGIVIEAQGTATPTAFANTHILDNEIHSVDREGIYTWSNWCKRTQLAAFWQDSLCFADWQASTGLVVRGNDLRDIGGDGIVAKGQDGALVEHNTVTGFNERAGSVNIGIWTANSDNGLFQYNEVSGGNTTKDGQSYDVDHSTSGTVFQYNLSHDNDGGFFLICPYDTPVTDFTIRYNISVNDRTRTFQVCAGEIDGGKIYNNTVSVGPGLSPVFLTESTTDPLHLAFTNNIVRKSGSGSVSWNYSDSNVTWDHNAFYDVTPPASATNSVTTAPGLVAPGTRDPHGYRLISGYGTLGAGTAVADNGGLDYYGNTVPATAAPNIGAYGGSGTATPVLTDTFDTLASSWTLSGTASAVTDPSGDLGNSARLTGTSTLTRTIAGTTARRVAALVRTDSATAPVTVEALDATGAVVAAGIPSDATPGEWHRVELTAPATATTLRLRATSTGTSYADDVIVQPIG